MSDPTPNTPHDPYPQAPDYRPGGGQAPMSPQDERTWGLIAHAAPLGAMLASAGTLGFVGSLVVYVLYKDRGPFVRAHAANSLNVQITTAIILVISLPLMLLLVGFVTFGAALLYALVVHVVGCIKAYNGEWWTPPFTPRFVS